MQEKIDLLISKALNLLSIRLLGKILGRYLTFIMALVTTRLLRSREVKKVFEIICNFDILICLRQKKKM